MIKIVQELGKRADGEIILCAAIWVNDKAIYTFQPRNIESGYVLCGYRHPCIIELFKKFDVVKGNCTQGFLTNKDRFVNRQEARKIALGMEQITEDSLHDTDLFSEDLY